MAVLVLLLGVVVLLLTVLVAGLLRSHAEILRALHELGVGLDPDESDAGQARFDVPRDLAPGRTVTGVAGVTPTGDAVNIELAGDGRLTLVAFLTSGCTTCSGFWSAFADRKLQTPGHARLVVATQGEEAESPARLRKFTPPDVPVVMSSAAWEAFDVPVAPYFALVDEAGGVIGEGAAATWEHLRQMMQQALDDAGYRPGRRRRDRRAVADPDVDAQLLGAGLQPGDASLYRPPGPSGDAPRP